MKLLSTMAVATGLYLAMCGTSTASERMDDGVTAYSARCASCHNSGVNGAPRTREPQDWENRSSLWDSVLLQHAKKGYLEMPAKGGNPSMSDYDVDVAAEYMLNISHPDLPRD
ncbi:MAG: c-type cytochrome [Proteobacteria bacterium]|nr:c-type cytochrome [Pseudomonadota bacterium]